MVDMTPEKQRILNFIAKNGPSTGYDMIKTKKFTAKVYPYLSDLVSDGLADLTEEETSGRRRKVYSLTLRGLTTAFTQNERRMKDTDRVVSSWESLAPFVFGKWDFFQEIGILDDARLVLAETIRQMMRWESDYAEELTDPELFQDVFQQTFFTYLIVPPSRLPFWHPDRHNESTDRINAHHSSLLGRLSRDKELEMYIRTLLLHREAYLQVEFPYARLWHVMATDFLDPLEQALKERLETE